MERTLTVATQPEGCVVDNRSGTLYVGEEVAGIWRFSATETAGDLVAPIDNRYLVADVEGLAIAPAGTDGGYLVASSQGDNAYAVFALPEVTPVGRFSIAEGMFGATEETDGIDLVLGDFGPQFPAGLFVAQDGANAPAAQNFKLVSWADVVAALGLE
jgi:3-phytase